jgi:hypothetical protein
MSELITRGISGARGDHSEFARLRRQIDVLRRCIGLLPMLVESEVPGAWSLCASKRHRPAIPNERVRATAPIEPFSACDRTTGDLQGCRIELGSGDPVLDMMMDIKCERPRKPALPAR